MLKIRKNLFEWMILFTWLVAFEIFGICSSQGFGTSSYNYCEMCENYCNDSVLNETNNLVADFFEIEPIFECSNAEKFVFEIFGEEHMNQMLYWGKSGLIYFLGEKPNDNVISKLKEIVNERLKPIILLLVNREMANAPVYKNFNVPYEDGDSQDTIVGFRGPCLIKRKLIGNGITEDKDLNLFINLILYSYYVCCGISYQKIINDNPHVVIIFGDGSNNKLIEDIESIVMEKNGSIIFGLSDASIQSISNLLLLLQVGDSKPPLMMTFADGQKKNHYDKLDQLGLSKVKEIVDNLLKDESNN